jgi:hypothetical protein
MYRWGTWISLALLAVVSVVAGTALSSLGTSGDSADREGASSSYIVRLKASVDDPAKVAREHAARHDGRLAHVYDSALKGYAATLPESAIDAIGADPRVAGVESDQAVTTLSHSCLPGEDPEVNDGMSIECKQQRIHAADFDCDPSDNPLVNQKLKIDCTANGEVDADVAIIDTGINSSSDFNIAGRVNCTLIEDPEDNCPVDDGSTTWDPHATTVAEVAAAKDNELEIPGVAPGARLWSVKVLAPGVRPSISESTPPVDLEVAMSHVIAGVDWVHEHSSTIEVANMSIGCKAPWEGDPEDEPLPEIEACETSAALNEAIDGAIGAGVVFVVAAGNNGLDTTYASPQNHPDVINVSLMTDFDGEPGGLHSEVDCNNNDLPDQQDDTSASYSSDGPGVEIAVPQPCGGTSQAAPAVAGAAALLASECKPTTRAGVHAIRNAIMAEGGYDYVEDADGIKEPLLDVGEETVFAPVLKNGGVTSGGAGTGCDWVSRPAESDVDGDGRSDVVTLHSDGTAHVLRGMIDGHPEGSIDADEATTSLGDVDPALLDGTGEYVVDVSDVTGDRRADLVTTKAGGGMVVRPGKADRTFDTAIESASWLNPVLDGTGFAEPIGVADVTGDGHGDLVSFNTSSDKLGMIPGLGDGTFTLTGSTASDAGFINSASTDGSGHYPLDVIDVDGDELADVVTVDTTNTINVYLAEPGGTFADPVNAGALDPVMDNGWHLEPAGLGDVNGDGRADLLTLRRNLTLPHDVRVRLGQADGTFGAEINVYSPRLDTSLQDGTGEEVVGLLDYNRDGKADMVTVDAAGAVRAYKAQVSGGTITFAAPVVQPGSVPTVRDRPSGHELATEKPLVRRTGCAVTGCPWPPTRNAEADVDRDGRADLVTLHSNGTAYVHPGNASGFDVANPKTSLGSVDSALLDGTGHYVVDVADVTGDGRADMVTNESNGGVWVHAGKGNRTFDSGVESNTWVTPVMASASNLIEPVGVADVTGDGRGDLVGLNVTTDAIGMVPGRADSTFDVSGATASQVGLVDYALRDGSGHYPLDVIDVNGDKLADVVTVDTTNTINVYLAGTGAQTGTFAATTTTTSLDLVMDNGWYSEPAGLGDVNGDGRADLLTLRRNLTLPHNVRVRLGQADGTFGAEITTVYPAGMNTSLQDGTGEEVIGLLDYSRDGKADMVSVDAGGTVRVYAAQGSGTSITFAAPVTQTGTVSSIRHQTSGHQMASEKPFIRRRGCVPTGCFWP